MQGNVRWFREQAALILVSAIAVGLIDAALVASRKLGAAGTFHYVPARIWIVAPLCWLLVAVVAAIPALIVFRRHGGGLVAGALAALLIAARLRSVNPAMAIGLAVLIFIVIVALARRIRIPRPGLVSSIAIAGLLASAIAVLMPWTKSGSPRSATSGPNVVIVFLDTVRHDGVFTPTGEVKPDLPALRQLAAQGTVFDRAYVTAPWTLPSHLSAVTGLGAHELGVDFDHQTYEKSVPTLAERFRRRGYRTAAVISNTFLNLGSGFARGFDTYEHATNGLDVCRTVPGVALQRYSFFSAAVCNWAASDVGERALRQIADGDAPYFLVLNFMDAHSPYYVERECRRPQDTELDAYAATIRCMDRQIGALVRKADAGRRDSIFVITSDHGESFGEHGMDKHGNSLHREVLHVPLIIRFPDRVRGRVSAPVSLADLPRFVESGTLVPSQRVAASLVPSAASGKPREISVIRDQWQLIVREGKEELIDLRTGAASAAPPDVIALLRADAAAVARATHLPRETEFRSLGYVH